MVSEDADFQRRSFLRMLGVGGGLYGLPRGSGAAGASRYGTSEVSANIEPSDIDSVSIAEISDTFFSQFRDDAESAMDDWIADITDDTLASWVELAGDLRAIYTELIGSASSAARDTLDDIDDTVSFSRIDEAISKIEFIDEYQSEISSALGQSLEELQDDNSDENGENSIAPPSAGSGSVRTIGAGAATATTTAAVPFEGVVDELKEAGDDLTDVVFDKLSDFGIKSRFESFWKDVDKFINEIEEGYRELLGPAIDGIVDLLASPITRLPEMWESVYSEFEAEAGAGTGAIDGPTIPTVEPQVFDLDFAAHITPLIGAVEGPSSTPETNMRSILSEPWPIDFLRLECPQSPRPINAVGFDVSIPGLEIPSISPHFGWDGVSRCVYFGAEPGAELGVDFGELLELAGQYESSWATIVDAIQSKAQEILTDIDTASTFGEYKDVAERSREFADFVEQASPSYITKITSSIDPDEIRDVGGSLVEDIDGLAVSTIDAITTINEILPAIEDAISRDTASIDGFEETAETTATVVQAWERREIDRLERETVERLVRESQNLWRRVTVRGGSVDEFDGVPESKLAELEDHLYLIHNQRRVEGVSRDLQTAEAVAEVNEILTELEDLLSGHQNVEEIRGFEYVKESTEVVLEAWENDGIMDLDSDVLAGLGSEANKLYARVAVRETAYEFEDVPDSFNGEMETLEERLLYLSHRWNTSNISRYAERQLRPLIEEAHDEAPDLLNRTIDLSFGTFPPGHEDAFKCQRFCRPIDRFTTALVNVAEQIKTLSLAIGEAVSGSLIVHFPSEIQELHEEFPVIKYIVAGIVAIVLTLPVLLIALAGVIGLIGAVTPDGGSNVPGVGLTAASYYCLLGFIPVLGAAGAWIG